MNFNHKESAPTSAEVKAQVKTGEQLSTSHPSSYVGDSPVACSDLLERDPVSWLKSRPSYARTRAMLREQAARLRGGH